MGTFINLAGKRFGNLIALERSTTLHHSGKIMWICKCQCGAIKEILSDYLRYGNVKSCGNCGYEKDNRSYEKHNMTKSQEHKIWIGMKGRCYNENNKRYLEWGGRGIKVCDRWINSFENFYADMGPRPTKKHSIERINNNGDYEPLNCKWATQREQARNKNNTIFLEAFGNKRTRVEWADLLGVNCSSIIRFMSRNGRTLEQYITYREKKSKSIINI